MKFKTTIKITAEAENRNEALEIVGEYLSGHLATGVDMKVRTTPVRNHGKYAVIAMVAMIAVGAFAIHGLGVRQGAGFSQSISGNNAIQPPLKTSSSLDKSAHFKNEWRSKHANEALNSLKK